MSATAKDFWTQVGGMLLISLALGLGMLAGQGVSSWLLGFVK